MSLKKSQANGLNNHGNIVKKRSLVLKVKKLGNEKTGRGDQVREVIKILKD